MPIETGILEVGDVLYSQSRWGEGLIKLVVTKVTPKQAIAGREKVLRQIEMKSICSNAPQHPEVKRIGNYGHIRVETPELNKKYEDEQLVKMAKKSITNIDERLITPENALDLLVSLKPFQKQNT